MAKCHALAHRIKFRDLCDALQIINHRVRPFGEIIAEMQRSHAGLRIIAERATITLYHGNGS